MPPQKPVVQQSDPWAEAAKNFHAQPQGEAAPAGGNDDWKVWQQQDATTGGNAPSLTAIDPHQSVHSMADVGKEGMRAFSNIGAGGLGLLSTIGRATPMGAVDDLIEGRPTIYQDAYHAMQHPWDTLQSMGHSAQEHPLETLEQAIGGAGAGAAVSKLGSMTEAAIPTQAKAGQLWSAIEKDAVNQPVSLDRATPHIQKMLQLGKEGGGTVPLPVRQLAQAGGSATPRSVPLLRSMQNDLNGVTEAESTPKPFLYPTARNFQSGLSRMSREDVGGMGGPMKGQLKQLNKALYSDVHDATSTVGRGDDYAKAMRMTRNAARMSDAWDATKKWALPAAAGTIGVGSLYKLANSVGGK